MGLLRAIIEAGVRNPVFANLVMLCMLAGGLLCTGRMVRESYPELSLDHISVEVLYPGATPEDVERGICTPIEEALQGLEGVREISSSSEADHGVVFVGLMPGKSDEDAILNEVKDRVDQLKNLPQEAEKPIVRNRVLKTQVLSVALFGDAPERTLKRMARDIRDELIVHPEISDVVISGVRADEIRIELSREAMQSYGLSLAGVVHAIKRSSLDVPAGVLKTADEELALRIAGQGYTAADYEDLVILDAPGSMVTLGQIATITEGFEDTVVSGRFNGQPGVLISIFKTPRQDATAIAAIVRDYVSQRQPTLPDRLNLHIWADRTVDIESRIDLLIWNGLGGLVLIFLTLLLFMDLRTSFWVSCDLPVAFAGAMVLIYFMGESINMLSLFALIMASGMIVDDSVVIADAVYSRRRAGMSPQRAAVEGATSVAVPVIGSSLTTMIAFAPLLFVDGVMGRFVRVIPLVMIGCLCASLIESFLSLPSHLAHHEPPPEFGVRGRRVSRLRRMTDDAVAYFVDRLYTPVYALALSHRRVTLSITAAFVLVTAGLVYGGHVRFVLLPKEDGAVLRTRVRMPEGTPAAETFAVLERIERAARKLNDDPEIKPRTEGPLVLSIYSVTGEFADFLSDRGSGLCEVAIELMRPEKRGVPDEEVIARWRHHIGEIEGATFVQVQRQLIGPTEQPIEIRLMGEDIEQLKLASLELQDHLSEFAGVTDVYDDLLPGKRQLDIRVKPTARMLGLATQDLAQELRFGYVGGEAVTLHRDREEVKVLVRFAEPQRSSVADIEEMRLRTPSGDEVPFREIADIAWSDSYPRIMHQDLKRRVRITADLDEGRANAEQIVRDLEASVLPGLLSRYDGISYRFGGQREMTREAFFSLRDGFIFCTIANLVLMAWMFRSYLQPLVIFVEVPLGMIGAILGHYLLGYDITMMSVFGMVALTGIVMNNGIVLVDHINESIRGGMGVRASVFDAGVSRFRAVFMTSITTVVDFLPMLWGHSGQAQSVLPMALSLTFGLTFAFVLTLFVLPSFYLWLNDARRFLRWLRRGGAFPSPESVEEAHQKRLDDLELGGGSASPAPRVEC